MVLLLVEGCDGVRSICRHSSSEGRATAEVFAIGSRADVEVAGEAAAKRLGCTEAAPFGDHVKLLVGALEEQAGAFESGRPPHRRLGSSPSRR